eukprot:SRR837773.13540.p2 GENE.SRR837773.13540~~SRR837773.13540.p2  ORF type:complete len:205 (-),score=42.50 SRR837773.13540:46-660(-)
MKPQIRTVGHFSRVATCAYAIAVAFYWPLGLFGYLSFGDRTPEDILAPAVDGSAGYSMTDTFANLSRVAVLFNTCAAFALNWFPARAMLCSLASTLRGGELALGSLDEEVESEKLRTSTLVWSAALWVGFTACLAAHFRRLGLLFDLIGAVFGSCEVFLYPSLFWWRLCADSSRFGRWPAYMLLTVGVFTMVTGVAVVFKNDVA